MQKRTIIMLALVLALAIILVGTTSVFAQEDTCTTCHNDTDVITGKVNSWEESKHGSGETTAYAGGRDSCAGCHSGGGFSTMIADAMNPDDVLGSANPSRIDCRACHQVHTSYTGDDWALETTAPVALYAFEGVTFDGGMGNLCANFHQPRRPMEAVDGIVNVSSTHWGPHHGPQAAMLLGVAGAGDVVGEAAEHATLAENTCVTCHMGEGAAHTFAPAVAACLECHEEAENFDINGVQTEVQAMLDELKAALVAKNMWDAEADELVVGEYPEAEAAALWNYIYIAIEDKSLGVHNTPYAKALIEASLAALGQ